MSARASSVIGGDARDRCVAIHMCWKRHSRDRDRRRSGRASRPDRGAGRAAERASTGPRRTVHGGKVACGFQARAPENGAHARNVASGFRSERMAAAKNARRVADWSGRGDWQPKNGRRTKDARIRENAEQIHPPKEGASEEVRWKSVSKRRGFFFSFRQREQGEGFFACVLRARAAAARPPTRRASGLLRSRRGQIR